MTKRKAQRDAALTSNNTPTESLPHQNDTGKRTNKNRPHQGPGANTK
ncbi:hypothetical protein [Halobacillus salinus]|nr:hypothetical protein [Halobacillus salinus]